MARNHYYWTGGPTPMGSNKNYVTPARVAFLFLFSGFSPQDLYTLGH